MWCIVYVSERRQWCATLNGEDAGYFDTWIEAMRSLPFDEDYRYYVSVHS